MLTLLQQNINTMCYLGTRNIVALLHPQSRNINKKSYRICICSDTETELHLFFYIL